MKCIHLPLILYMDSGSCQIQGKTNKPSSADKIKLHVIKEQMS